MSLPSNFWTKTRSTDCLIWTGAVNTKGYPCFAMNGVSQLAHRLAYEEARGPIPVLFGHICRVRNCVNVDHLEVVSIAENNRRKRTTSRCDRRPSRHRLTPLVRRRSPPLVGRRRHLLPARGVTVELKRPANSPSGCAAHNGATERPPRRRGSAGGAAPQT